MYSMYSHNFTQIRFIKVSEGFGDYRVYRVTLALGLGDEEVEEAVRGYRDRIQIARPVSEENF